MTKLSLTTHSNLECGGYDVFIELHEGTMNCTTSKIAEFERGDILSWTGSELGSCRNKVFHFDMIANFKVKTTSDDDFCPKYLTIEMNNAEYKSEKMNEWFDKSKNSDTLRAAYKSKGESKRVNNLEPLLH